MGKKEEVLDERAALVEMYKAGFLDAYKIKGRIKTSREWAEMNKMYKLAFFKRFGAKITKELKK